MLREEDEPVGGSMLTSCHGLVQPPGILINGWLVGTFALPGPLDLLLGGRLQSRLDLGLVDLLIPQVGLSGRFMTGKSMRRSFSW